MVASTDNGQITAQGNNDYVVWWDNKTRNFEVLFARSTNNGATFGDAINISNSSVLASTGARIAVLGNHVYISWIETNPETKQKDLCKNEGETFGKPIILNTRTPSKKVKRGWTSKDVQVYQ